MLNFSPKIRLGMLYVMLIKRYDMKKIKFVIMKYYVMLYIML